MNKILTFLKQCYWFLWYYGFTYSLKSPLDITHNPNSSTKELEVIFSRLKHLSYIRSSIARHPNASSKLIEEIYELNTDPHLYYLIAVNRNTNVKILENIIFKISDVYWNVDRLLIKNRILQHPNCTEDLALLLKAYEFTRNLP
jgi:hypothetical protein